MWKKRIRIHKTDPSTQQRSLLPHGKSFLADGEDNRTHGEKKEKLFRGGSRQAGVVAWSVLVPFFLLRLSMSNGSGLLLFSKCWVLMERRVPILPRPPGTKQLPGKTYFARVLG